MQLQGFSRWILCGLSLTAFACGGRPTLDEVQEHFTNPTGSTTDKTSLISATGKQDASSTALRVAGDGNVFGGIALTAVGKRRGLDRLEMRSLFRRELTQLKALSEGKRQLALNGDSDHSNPCVDEKAVQSALGELALSLAFNGGKSASADFKYTIDLDECSMGEVTGSMSVRGEIEFDENSFRFMIEEDLNEVCETTGQKSCVDGEFAMEIATTGSVEAEEVDSVSFTAAWFVDATWNEDGQPRSAETKGGVQLAADDMMAKLEVLMFVIDAAGNEVTLVLKVSANEDGSGTVEIRGKDGSISCVINADGSGECVELLNGEAVMGESKISWTDIEAKDVEKSDAFGAY